MKGTAYFENGTKMYTVLFHIPKNKLTKEMWLLWLWRNDLKYKWFPQFFYQSNFSWGIEFGRFHFAKSIHEIGVL